MNPDACPAVDVLEQIAREACQASAALIRARIGRAVRVGLKSSPTDVVTDIDLESEALIRRHLTAATPDAGIVGEEEGSSHIGRRLQWIVDPLDGTVNFTYTVPIVAVSVAAAWNGTVVAGAVIDVARDELFSAARGNGARNDQEPIHASPCTELGETLLATGYSYAAALRRDHARVIAELLPLVRDVRCIGSAALNLCWLACGRLDAYYERDTKLWDFAAGSLIASEAGARVERPCPENQNSVIAAADGVFAELRRTVVEITG